jgi:hypothetical protein
MTTATLELVRQRMRWFAEREALLSPLYAHLAEKAAADDEVADLLTAAPREFAQPTLLFAAAHRLVQAEPIHPLTAYYPSLGGTCGVDGGTWPLFRLFVLERADRMRELIAARTTQTNEVRRAALLYPAVAIVAKQARAPVGLLEVGASAGLLLGLDRYSYRYQTEQAGPIVAGPARSALGLHCTLELAPGATLPAIPRKIAVAARVGLDRAPVDLADEEQYAWLEACIWADQPERLRLFGAAAAVLRRDPPELITGDAVDDLAAAAGRIPVEVPLVVITSNAMQYLVKQEREAFIAGLGELAGQRRVWWLSHEEYRAGLAHLLPGRDDLVAGEGEQSFGVLGLTHWGGGRPVPAALARTAWHGQRLQWLAGG